MLPQGKEQVLQHFRVQDVPGDGNCYVRAVACCLGLHFQELKDFIIRQMVAYPDLRISDLPLRQWVEMDSDMPLEQYIQIAERNGFWCGGIENAVLSSTVNMVINIYSSQTWKPIAQFDLYESNFKRRVRPLEVNVLYTGGHYLALMPR